MTRPAARRPAFTLIELMVAAALSLVIMTIMALAFQSGMGTLSNLKSLGDSAEHLRTAEVLLRQDLDADHATVDDSGGALRVGELMFDANPPAAVRQGYFRVTSETVSEGSDSDGIPSLTMKLANPTANTIAMTTRRTGRTTSDLYAIGRPSNTASKTGSDVMGANYDTTQWAEVKWMLGTQRTIGGVPMYPLHRIVKPLGVPPTAPVTPSNLQPAASGTADYGTDIVMTNVLSFAVQPLFVTANSGAATTATPDFQSNTSVTFDTTKTSGNDSPFPSGAGLPGRRCAALKVTIRVFDIKTRLARQVTLIVKM